MNKKIAPEDLQNESEFELIAEISHQQIREFVVEQIQKEKYIVRIYSIYQILMMILFAYLLSRSILLAFNDHSEAIAGIGFSFLFSLSALIIIHELLHAAAYLLTGARKISFGIILKKFIFYAMADRQVIKPKTFHVVALTPFVVVKLMCLLVILSTTNQQYVYFFLTVMCLHSLFCAGDIAMLAFYRLNREKEIYNFDDRSKGKTYFYSRINKGKV